MVQFDLPVFKRQRVRGADGQRFPRLALRHLVEDDEEGFGRAEFQFEAAVGERDAVTLAGIGIPNPRVTAPRNLRREGDLALVGVVHVHVGQEEEGVAVAAVPTCLQEEAVGVLDGHVVRQVVLADQLLVPFEELVVLGFFDEDKAVGVGLQFLDPRLYLGVALFVIFEAERLGRVFFDAENAAALGNELVNLRERRGGGAGHFG